MPKVIGFADILNCTCYHFTNLSIFFYLSHLRTPHAHEWNYFTSLCVCVYICVCAYVCVVCVCVCVCVCVQPDVVELRQQMSPSMTAIQMSVLAIVKAYISELKRYNPSVSSVFAQISLPQQELRTSKEKCFPMQ